MKRYILLVLCLLWVGFIFYNSCQSGYESNSLSLSLVKDIDHGKTTEEVHNESNSKADNPALSVTKKQQDLNIFLRKNAHALEYLVLAVLLAAAFRSFGRNIGSSSVNILFISLLYAVSDEYHQIFVPGRGSYVTDVIIDFIGSVIGLAIIFLADRKLKDRLKLILKNTGSQE